MSESRLLARFVVLIVITVSWALHASAVEAQVTIHPRSTTPAAWERFAVQVVNHADTAVVTVEVAVPDAITILGVETPVGWSAQTVPGTETTAQLVRWTDGVVAPGAYREFAFLGRVIGDARQRSLVFPVIVTRADGSRFEEQRLRVSVVGRTQLSVRGVTAIAGTALGISILALVVALATHRSHRSRTT